MDICLEMFNCLPAEKAIAIRKRNFLNRFCVSNNELCKIFTDRAKKELATLLAYATTDLFSLQKLVPQLWF